MKTSRSLRIERWLKWSPVAACLGGVIAVVLGVWVPFYPSVLAIAVGAGFVLFLIEWWKLRSRREFLLLDPIVSVVGCSIALNLVPDGVGFANRVLSGAQIAAVWVFSVAGLFAIFRRQWRKDVQVYAS